jgi:hypothetical protein
MENRGTRTTQHPSPAEKGPALNPKTHHTPEFPLLTSLAGGEPIENTRIVVELDTPSQHGWTRFTIRPGVVDADAVELYGYSKCHLLAGAVNALTGWRMCLIRQLREGVWRWAHAGCVDASALFHDIHGPRNLDEVVEGVTEEYGLDADALVFDTFEECARFVMSGRAVTGWSEGVDPLLAEVTLYFAVILLQCDARRPRPGLRRRAGRQRPGLLLPASRRGGAGPLPRRLPAGGRQWPA